jgi:PAS domain S-box-containing protein
MWYYDVAADTITFSRRASALYGLSGAGPFSPAEVIAHVLPEDQALVARAVADALAAPGDTEYEYRVAPSGGDVRWVSVRCRTLRDDQARAVGNIGVAIDVTARKEHERRLEAAGIELEKRVAERTAELAQATAAAGAERRRLYDVLETVPAMVCLLTSDRHVAFANRAFRDKFGESNGRHCYEYCFGESAPCSFCQSFKPLETGKPHRWEARLPDGGALDAYDFPFTDADGTKMILEMDVDITAQRRSEQALSDRTAEAQRMAGQLRALAAQLAQVEQFERKRLAKMLHDHIQQLLVAARMRLDGLPAAGGRVEGIAHEVDGILAEALAASRSLTVELSPPVLHEAGLNGGLGWLAAWMSQKHGFTVNFTSDGRAEPLREEMRFLLFECVRELLLNAVKHSGVREASVTLERRDEDSLRIVVQDKGRGFDPAALAARGPADATFGLFSIQQRLAHFSGDVRIDSAPDKGVRVTLAAPLLRPETQEQAPEPAGAAAPAAPPPVNGKIRVLVVDDHTVVRQGIVGLLRAQKDIEVVGQAGNGREAVEAAEKLRPNIVIMDVNMPVMSGIEATKLLRARIPGTRVIGLSLYADAGIAAGMRDAGAVDYLTKDGAAENLIAAIRAHGKP